MPVKRRSTKARNLTITPELFAAYRRHKELEAIGCKCIPQQPHSPMPPRCSVCEELHDVRGVIHSLTDGRPWLPDLLEVDKPEPDTDAPWPILDPEYWRALWDLRQELENELAKESKNKRGDGMRTEDFGPFPHEG
ncbi:MAG: hypothetical protein KF748_01170 [Xanthobacteraceae bacterium]|nr:hypothetical protein [Xanthobacteraceae bacterium]MBX3547743.1 hypothetical protein [Xanthobacteraceae bacterium]